MIRMAVAGEGELVAKRGTAEVANADLRKPFPAAAAIEADMAASHHWYIDDQDERVVMHEYFDGDFCYVTWLLGPSIRGEELARWLANKILDNYGAVTAKFPVDPNSFSVLAATLTKASRVGVMHEVPIQKACDLLNRRARGLH